MNALTLSASRTRNRVVILHAFALRPQLPTISSRLRRALSAAWATTRQACTAERLVTAATALCAITATCAALADAAASGTDTAARLTLALASITGLTLAVTGAFITSTTKGGAK